MAKKKTTSKKKSRTAKKPSQTKVDQPSTAAELWEHFKPLYDSLPYEERWRFISSTEYIYGCPNLRISKIVISRWPLALVQKMVICTLAK